MALITPAKFISLKALVKAECLRRNQNGSVAAYGGTAYDFSRTPTAGTRIDKEFYEKIAVPINAINGTTATSADRIVTESELTNLETVITALSAKAMSPGDSNTGCKSSCTGLCYTACAGTCTGCSGTCTGCSGSCTGSCDTSCSWVCQDDCNNDCYGGCDGGCYGGCDGCSGCGDSCSSGCSDACSSSMT